ncbi:MAG: hypothetical protein AAF662_03870 [Pseudomonadota bacterium]
METYVESIAAEFGGRYLASETPAREARKPRILWGVASTGISHLGYLPYLALLKKLANQGWDVVVLISEFHAYLDDRKTPWYRLQEKYSLYRAVFGRYFSSVEGVTIMSGSELYLNGKYFLNLMRHATRLPAHGLLESGAQMLRSDEAKFADLLYVYMMMFDVVHLDLDLVLCGEDEAQVYELCLTLLQSSGSQCPAGLFLPMMAGLEGQEMHASSPASNILRLDASSDEIEHAFKNIRTADWTAMNSNANPLSYLKDLPELFSAELREQWGELQVATWVERACEELGQHLSSLRFSY